MTHLTDVAAPTRPRPELAAREIATPDHNPAQWLVALFAVPLLTPIAGFLACGDHGDTDPCKDTMSVLEVDDEATIRFKGER